MAATVVSSDVVVAYVRVVRPCEVVLNKARSRGCHPDVFLESAQRAHVAFWRAFAAIVCPNAILSVVRCAGSRETTG